MKSLMDTKLVLIIKEYLQEKFLIIYLVFNINIVNTAKKADQVGWLFNFGKKEQVERNLYNALMKENKNYDDLDLRQKTYSFNDGETKKLAMKLLQKMYQGYRKLASNAAFKKGDYSLPDLMNQYYSENVQVDFTPVF